MRDRRAVELRAAGLTFAAIGAELGVTGEAARQAVNGALEATAESIAREANRLRALEAERLDRAAAVLMPEIEAGDLRAHEVWLRNRTRHAALLGLDLKPEADVAPPLTVVLTGTSRPEEAPEGAYLIDPAPALPASRLPSLEQVDAGGSLRVMHTARRYGSLAPSRVLRLAAGDAAPVLGRNAMVSQPAGGPTKILLVMTDQPSAVAAALADRARDLAFARETRVPTSDGDVVARRRICSPISRNR